MKFALRSTLAAAALSLLSTATLASHLFVTDPSINGVALDSAGGFTNPTINATVGSTLNVKLGVYDYAGGTITQDYTMHFNQTGGGLTLGDITLTGLTAGDGFANTIYFDFDQILLAAGTWTGFLEPIQNESCPSYRYGDGTEGGNGCGSPSESIGFTLNVTNSVPEPGSMALFGLALAVAGFARRRSA